MNDRELTKIVGKVIASRRIRNGMTQDNLAEKLGLARESISKMEQGAIAPKFERLRPLSHALNCSVEELFHMPADGTTEASAIVVDMINPLPLDQQKMVVEMVTQLMRILRKI
jgi:transcriptional regulator with XRE-family HTH domain